MNPKYKTALAVVAGVAIGMTLFGGALAAHALVRAVAVGAPAHGAPAMSGPRGGQMGAPQAFGACQGDGGCGSGACPQGQQPMMDPRGGCPQGVPGAACPQGDPAVCPQGAPGACPDGGICPSTPDVPTSES